MVKVLPATYATGVVTADGLPVPGVTILCQGLGSSSGILILEGTQKTYVAKTSPDLDSALEQVITAIGKISDSLTSIAAAMTGPTTAPPPTLPALLIQIAAASASLSALKGSLK